MCSPPLPLPAASPPHAQAPGTRTAARTRLWRAPGPCGLCSLVRCLPGRGGWHTVMTAGPPAPPQGDGEEGHSPAWGWRWPSRAAASRPPSWRGARGAASDCFPFFQMPTGRTAPRWVRRIPVFSPRAVDQARPHVTLAEKTQRGGTGLPLGRGTAPPVPGAQCSGMWPEDTPSHGRLRASAEVWSWAQPLQSLTGEALSVRRKWPI